MFSRLYICAKECWKKINIKVLYLYRFISLEGVEKEALELILGSNWAREKAEEQYLRHFHYV